jgi:hypothetical protein
MKSGAGSASIQAERPNCPISALKDSEMKIENWTAERDSLVGRTDMRKGMNGLALQVQQALGRGPHAGDLYVFRGARGDLIKIVWHDGIGMSLFAKRLERGRFAARALVRQ